MAKGRKQITQEIITSQRNEAAREWLRSHELINVAALCRRIDYDRGNFWHFEYGQRDLPEDALERLEKVITNYGFKIK